MISLKKIIALIVVFNIIVCAKAQVLYSERFNAVAGISTGTYVTSGSTQSYLYANVPTTMTSINNVNLFADSTHGNYPYNAPLQSIKGWLTYRPASITGAADTFAVSTSWLSPASTADAWLITPTINNIAANTVLTWQAMAPDANYQDGYVIYVSTNTVTAPVASDFTAVLTTITAENSTWQTRSVSLGAYAGQNIRIAFRNNSTDKYQLWIDDIVAQNISNAYDMSAVSNDTYKYATINTNNAIIATFQNKGYAAVTSVVLNYKAGVNTIVSETQNLATPLSYLGTQQFTVSIPLSATIPSYNDLKVWISSINAQADQVNNNDTARSSITISSIAPNKKVLIEGFTGAWCGWCPDGNSRLQSIDTLTADSSVIVASLHDNDNMSVASGTTLIASNDNSFPSAMIDRYYFSAYGKQAIDRLNWNTYLAQRQAMVVPATVTITSVSYNSTTRQINATVSSTFVGNVKGDYRLNLYIKENNVYGPINDNTDNNWNQHSFMFNVPTSPYYQIGSVLNSSTNPVTYLMNANQYKHQYVVDDMLDGAYGVAGVIPTNTATAGQTYNKTYTYTLPTAIGGEFRYNANNMYLIATLSEYNLSIHNRAILNAAEVKLTTDAESTVGIKDLTSSTIQLNLFPNPTTDVCFLNYTLKETQPVKVSVYNALGELVLFETTTASAGETQQGISLRTLTSGNYSVKVDFKNETVVKKLTIIK